MYLHWRRRARSEIVVATYDLAERYPKYGCPTLHDMPVIDGEVKNPKRTYGICREKVAEDDRQLQRQDASVLSRPVLVRQHRRLATSLKPCQAAPFTWQETACCVRKVSGLIC
jgi:hypothetical protein